MFNSHETTTPIVANPASGATQNIVFAPASDRASTASKRLAPVIAAAQAAGSVTLLVGQRGNGRLFLATTAAHQLSPQSTGSKPALTTSQRSGIPHSTVSVLPEPRIGPTADTSVFGDLDPASRTPQERAKAFLATISDLAVRPDCTLVAPGIDLYTAADLEVFKLVLNSLNRPRIIATAASITAAVDSATHGITHTKLPVGSIGFIDADAYLSHLLGVQRIEPDTLRRWYQKAEGTSHGITALALGSSTSGTLHRTNGVAWVSRVDDNAPPGFAAMHTTECSVDELQMLELVALAQPITETTLLRHLDALVLASLFDRGFVSWRQTKGRSALVITQGLLAESLCAEITPPRRLSIYDTIYELLDADRHGQSPVLLPELLTRLVHFGVLCNKPMPAEWLWTAFELPSPNMDPRAALRLSLSVTAHPELLPQERAQALVTASDCARLLSDSVSLQTVERAATAILNDPTQAEAITATTYVSLSVAVLYSQALRHLNADRVNDDLRLLEQRFAATNARAFEMARTSRAYALACVGRLVECFDLVGTSALSGDLSLEWIRSRGRAAISLILAQRGLTEQAESLSKRMHALSQLGASASRPIVDLQGFSWIVSLCLGGRSEAAAHTWESLALNPETFSSDASHYAGLLDAARVILSIQEGRWSDADQQSEQLLAQLQRYDSFGLVPMIAAARAYALAVLGSREEAIKNLHLADVPKSGVSGIVGGLVRIHKLRARQWLRESDVGAAADALANWAHQRRLPLIELMAIHTATYERGTLTGAQLEHARMLATGLESERTKVIMDHIEQINVDPINDAPQVRLLSKIGIWIPLPPSPTLTPREREVALFAALGYSSKFIAARLGVSARTIDTHITNVFTKLGVQNREELALWFERHPNAPAARRTKRATLMARAPR